MIKKLKIETLSQVSHIRADFKLTEKLNEVIDALNNLIPTKTQNLSNEKGFDLTNLEKTIVEIKLAETGIDYRYHILKAIEYLQDELNQANGENSDIQNNPVGQVDEMLQIISTIRSHVGRENTIDVQYGLDKLVALINKPRETDNEKPFTNNDLATLMESVMLNSRLQRDYAMHLHNKLLKLV